MNSRLGLALFAIGTTTIAGFTVPGLVMPASAQSGSRIVYPQHSTMRSAPTQGWTSSGSTTQQGRVPGSGTPSVVGRETFESKFWRYLRDSHYRQWAPVAGTTGDAYPGQSPHGAMLKMYLNRTAAGRPDELPEGSVIVKENFGADGKTLMAITTMYRPKGYTGWYWTKYNPDGSVASKDGKRLAGKVQGCIDCHSSAGGDDQAFFND